MNLNELKSAFRKPYGFATYPLLGVLFLLILFIAIREPLSRYYIDQKIASFNRNHNSRITYSSLHFNGLTSITLHDFSIGEIGKEPLTTAASIKIKVGFWKLLLQRLSIESVDIEQCCIKALKNGATDNYSFIFKQKNRTNEEKRKSRRLSEIVERLSNYIFDLIPNKLLLRQLSVTLSSNNHQLQFTLPKLEILDRNFSAKIEMNESTNHTTFFADGVLDKESRELALKIYGSLKQPFIVPWIEYRNNARISFDTAYFKLKHNEQSNEEKQTIIGSGELTNLQLYHKRIAADTVAFSRIGTEYKLNFGPDYIEYDSISTVTVNNLQLHPYGYYQPKPNRHLILSLHKPLFNATELFSSLPDGLFDNFAGIEVEGQLSYSGLLDLNMAFPDSLIFESELSEKGFNIKKAGATDFSAINDFSYTHTIFENERAVKKVVLGSSNGDFTPYESLPSSLKNAILLSEDGSFFEHGGFSLEAFRKSIITNIKTKRFARGGSTISMQLVKNLFLNRKKNIARKVEELLIVWMLERHRMVSKNRMFEIYANIIEWGPGIYGIADATRFYFNKEVSSLTLDESIYLAAIIPSPKNYQYLFNEDGSFKEYIINHYQFILKRMVEHDLILQSEADATEMKVTLAGEAKERMDARKKAETKEIPETETETVIF